MSDYLDQLAHNWKGNLEKVFRDYKLDGNKTRAKQRLHAYKHNHCMYASSPNEARIIKKWFDNAEELL